MVLCAKGDIDAGVEIRVDYNFGSQGVGTFHHYLTASNCGVPKVPSTSWRCESFGRRRGGGHSDRAGGTTTTGGRAPLEAAWPTVDKSMATRR